MLIDNWRDWKTNFVRLAGISLFNFALLFVLGFDLFQDFLASTLQQQSQPQPGMGFLFAALFLCSLTPGIVSFPNPLFQPPDSIHRVFELSFLALFFLCLITLIVLAFIRRENGFNPYLLLACTVGALIIPAVSNDYKLPLIIGPVSILLSGWPAMKKMSKKIASIVLLIIVLMAFWTTLYPFKIKPEILHNSMPVLLLILIAVTVVNLLTDESNSLNLVAGTDDENNGETQST
jgi:hypothetical protein